MTQSISGACNSAIFGTVVQSMRLVASDVAVVNSHSPAAQLLSITANPVAPHSAAPLPSPGSGRGRTVERGGPSHALRFVPAFTSYEGPRAGFCNLSPAQALAGRVFSFLRSLVQDANQTASGFFHRFQFAPVRLLLSALCHAHKKAWRYEHGAQRNRAIRTGA